MGGLLAIVACTARLDKLQSRDKKIDAFQAYCDDMLYFMGVRIDTLVTMDDSLAKGETFTQLMDRYEVEPSKSKDIAAKYNQALRSRKMHPARKFTALVDGSGPDALRYLVFRHSPTDYLVCAVADSSYAYWYKKPIMRRERVVTGEIEQSLRASLSSKGFDNKLINSMSQIFAWTIDFSRLKPGDRYKIIVEEDVVDGAIVRVTGIKAALFEHNGKSHYACLYKLPGEKHGSYYDQDGNNLRQAFLKMPLKYGRLTSKYNLKRFHPVLNTVKPHLGTDFAAPSGTPIIATGSGTVVEAGRTNYNGNYVKIKHNNTYATQYLHMKGFAKGIKKGAKVKQGDVIGYVGMTGLATGPHVCYRFWKNGKQIDPLKYKGAFSEPINPAYKEDYLETLNMYKSRMDAKIFDYTPVLHALN
jgi:murein DD-endopeptidase MepM/ murein hydrolase activator NlpD